MSNYYNDMLALLLGSGQYGPNQQAIARSDASGLEDDRLRGMMGSKTKRRKDDKRPEGAYALAQYPQLGIAMMQAAQGQMAPGGNAANIGLWMKDRAMGADPYAPMQRDEERKKWAAYQQRLLGGW